MSHFVNCVAEHSDLVLALDDDVLAGKILLVVGIADHGDVFCELDDRADNNQRDDE